MRDHPTPVPRLSVDGVQTAGACDSAQPRFVSSMLRLKASLGATMGVPVECEHAINAQGDTQQRTTSGLAYTSKAATRSAS